MRDATVNTADCLRGGTAFWFWLSSDSRFDRATGTLAATATGLTLTSPGHMAPAGQTVGADSKRAKGFEVRPSGNGVNLEDEMMKAGENQSDYQLAASLYQHSLTTLKIAIGKS